MTATNVTPADYERAVLERFKTIFPAPEFTVSGNRRLPGTKSKANRQIDVMVSRSDTALPILVVEAKRHARAIDVGRAAMTIGLVQDIGSFPAVMVSSEGFSAAARNQLGAEGIQHLTITLKEAEGLRWVGVVAESFGVDREFREITGQLVENLRLGDTESFLDLDLPFEEWLAVFRTSLSLFPETTSAVLLEFARSHFDDGVRFNAVAILDEAGGLPMSTVRALLEGETDPDTVELLTSIAEYAAETE